jgi:hypothetical protein
VKRLVLLLAACTKSATTPATTISEDAPTPLQIVVLDDYSSRDTCDGVAPRKVEVLFDGKSAGVVEVPCRTKTVMPPPQIAGPTITLAAGTYTVVARELGVGNSVEKQLELPVITSSFEDGTDQLGTKLPVWVSDDHIDVAAPRPTIEFEKPQQDL